MSLNDPRSASDGALRPYLRAIRAQWVFFLGVVAITVAAGVAYHKTRSVEYQATATILVTPLPQGNTELLGLPLMRESADPPRTVETAGALLDGSDVAERAARQLGPAWTPSAVDSLVQVRPEGTSNIVDITAAASDATSAARIATIYAQSAIAVRNDIVKAAAQRLLVVTQAQDDPLSATDERIAALRQLTQSGDPTFSLANAAAVPAQPRGPGLRTIVVVSLLGGVMLGSLAALATERLGASVADEGELLDVFPRPVLARLPRDRRWAASQGPSAQLDEAVRYLSQRLATETTPPEAVAVVSPASRDGKTSVAVLLARALGEAGHAVILVDCDLRRPSVARMVGGSASSGLTNALYANGDLADAMMPWPAVPHVSLLTPTHDEEASVLSVPMPALHDFIERLKDAADFVIIDTPPLGEVADGLALAVCADTVLMVVRPRHTRRDRLRAARDALAAAGINVRGHVVVGGDEHLVPGKEYSRAGGRLEAAEAKRNGASF